jgi:hypothetical protein
MNPALRPACPRCQRGERSGGGFRLQTADGLEAKCLACALRHPALVRRSAAAAALVGSVLTVINQGDVLISGSWPVALLWKLPLTYAVPFIVATWGALANSRAR